MLSSSSFAMMDRFFPTRIDPEGGCMSTRSAIHTVEIVVGINFTCLSSHPLPWQDWRHYRWIKGC